MTRYAYFDHTQPSPVRVTGWYDTNALHYPNLPDSDDLLEITDEQWVARMDNPNGWSIQDGSTLVVYVPPDPPPPTLQEQAVAMMQTGIQITCWSDTNLDGWYSVDSATNQRMMGILSSINAGLGLPGGGETFGWLDVMNELHQFSADRFKQLAKAVMNFTYTLDTIIGGADLSLPTLPVEIDV